MEKKRKTGIDIVGDVPWGTHFCQFYQTKEDLIDILIPYFKAGLDNNESCLWVTSQPLSTEEAKGVMQKHIPDFDHFMEKGQIEIVSHTQWYLKGGAFDLQRVLNAWVEKLNQSLIKGYDGLRVTGNTFWLTKKDWKDFADYEYEVNHVIGKYKMLAICTYSLDKCGAYEIIDVVRNHQFALIRQEGQWELFESSEHKRLNEALRKAYEELEKCVQERTAELLKTNELLERVFSSIDLLIAYMDKDFNFIRVNRAYAEADEHDPDFYIGKNHFALFPNQENESIFRKVVETGEPCFVFEKPFKYVGHPERGVTSWDWSLQPIKESDGKVSGVVLSLVNVTERKRAQEAQERLISILEETSDFVGIANVDRRVLHFNKAARKMLGISENVDISKVMIPDTHPEWAKAIVLEEGIPTAMCSGIWSGETALLSRDGREIPVSQVILAHKSPDGKVEYLSTIMRDITERKEQEKLIQVRNAILELFSKKASRKEYLDAVVNLILNWSKCHCAGIRVLNEQGYIPYEAYLGFSNEFWEKENWLSIKHDQCACIRVVIGGKPDTQDVSLMTPIGSFYCNNTVEFVRTLSEEERSRFRGVCVENGFLSIAIIPIRYHEKILGAIHLADEREGMVPLKVIEFIELLTHFVGEAVNRFNLEDGLRESENRLRFLSSQLLNIQEKERKRVAHELHDGIGQMLTAIKFKVENTLQQKNQNKNKTKRNSLETIIPMIQESIEEVRRIQMDLRPPTLDDLGILATMTWFCRQYQTIYSNIHIENQIDVEENEVPASLKTVIYRVMQEALNNIAKHSQADLVRLSLRKTDHKIELAIEDNGVGFNLEAMQSLEASERRFGITSMKERSELSGGSFSIMSTKGKGTMIQASWPL